MACDYQAIRRDNERRYGTDIGRIGPMLLANRYDDRTHFIFELLQNAEDALARRDGWQGSRAVTFHLTGKTLRVSHFGLPFDEPDVRGICGIAESTKGSDGDRAVRDRIQVGLRLHGPARGPLWHGSLRHRELRPAGRHVGGRARSRRDRHRSSPSRLT